MLAILEEIFRLNTIEVDATGKRIPLHSNTSLAQGLFLQEVFDAIKPIKSLEVGFAYGISTLFILEKYREYSGVEQAHLVIEPDDWQGAAQHNILKAGLSKFLQVERCYSYEILSKLWFSGHRIQFAYIDSTKIFDILLHDFYFIDKILDIGGVVILDDCGGGWPGVQRLARFINTLPHYELYRAHGVSKYSLKRKVVKKFVSTVISLIPFKSVAFPTIDFKSDDSLGLNFACICFRKVSNDKRQWNWDERF